MSAPPAGGAPLRLLLLAYYFPPDGGPGAQRPISFARHLPAHGMQCTVLTRSPPPQRGKYDPADASALAAVERRCRIVRAEPAAVSMRDLVPALVRAGDAAIRAERPDVVLATMSPFELWRAAAELGRRHGLPVVFDLRDPWALDGVQSHRTWWHWRRELAEMRRMLRAADGIVANTPECRGLFLGAEPRLAPERVTVVTNGWDAADFAAPLPEVPAGPTLRLLHAGSFLCRELYPRGGLLRTLLRPLRHAPEPIRPGGRTPRHVLAAIRRLRERGAPAGRDVRFVAMGQIDEWLERCVRESGVADAVELCSYQPHDRLVDAMRRADALFLTLHGLPPGRRARIVPGKTYEYLASGRPILAALPDGDARDLAASSPRAFVAAACDEAAIAERLEALHAAWRAGAFVRAATPSGIGRYERGRLAGDLAAFLRGVVARRRAGTPPDPPSGPIDTPPPGA